MSPRVLIISVIVITAASCATVQAVAQCGPGFAAVPMLGVADPTRPVCLPLQPTTVPRWQGPCRQDSFFIERPLWSAGPIPTLGECPSGVEPRTFAGCLAAAMTRAARAHPLWFCGDRAACDERARYPLVARVEPVLAARPDAPWRPGDSHLRYFRLSFESTTARDLAPVTLPVQSGEAMCHFMSTLRRTVASVVGPEGQAGVLIGRECSVMPADAAVEVAAHPDGRMATWHLRQMEVAPSAEGHGPVDVALIDTGVSADVVAPARPPPFIDYPVSEEVSLVGSARSTSPAPHRHGTAMALFIHSLAPHANIVSYRALDERGIGDTATLARAIDLSVERARTSGRPTILNLSVGWPPELSRPRRITASYAELGPAGAMCSTYEDGVGAAVAFGLDVARRRASDGRPLFVVAAMGNRPLRPAALEAQIHARFDFEPIENTALAQDPCRANEPSPEWFYPGQLARRASCRTTSGSGGPLRSAVGVSGVDALDRPIGVGIVGSEAGLVAPAEHVYASSAAFIADALTRPASGACGVPHAEYPPVRLPAAFTGSSVASAFVAGAAARAQGRVTARGEPALSWSELEAALYVSGDDLCRANEQRVPVRRLAIDGLDRLLAPAPLAALRACAPADPATLRSRVLDVCAPVVATLAPFATRCTAPRSPVGWSSYAPTPCRPAGDVPPSAVAAVPVASCGPGGCAYERVPTPDLLGALGPQPPEHGCPECGLSMFTDDGRVWFDLNLDIYDGFLGGTEFDSATLVLQDVRRDSASAVSIDLGPLSDVKSWRPGDSVVVKRVPAPEAGPLPGLVSDSSSGESVLNTWTQYGRAQLYLKVVTPNEGGSATEALSISVLRLVAE